MNNQTQNGWRRLAELLLTLLGVLPACRTLAAFIADLGAGTLRWALP
jgi:hypothetical protein